MKNYLFGHSTPRKKILAILNESQRTIIKKSISNSNCNEMTQLSMSRPALLRLMTQIAVKIKDFITQFSYK